MAGQIYLMDNPLLREPLEPEHVKPRRLGHWGTTPGLNFIYVHLNRVIRERNLDILYVCGPGHGGPAMVANTYLEGSYGYKIANPTLLARMPDEELHSLFTGYAYEPFFVEGLEPLSMPRAMAGTMDAVFDSIRAIQEKARSQGASNGRPRWPMIVLRSPKGWTGPKEVDGKRVEGFWRSHQVPVSNAREDPDHRRILEEWMRSYRPEELFDPAGCLLPDLATLAPDCKKRMGTQPHANGGALKRDLVLPDWKHMALDVSRPGSQIAESTRVHGFQEEGTTTTLFDMAVMNQLDRFHLALAAIRRLAQPSERLAGFVASIEKRLEEHDAYIRDRGIDMPEIADWKWPSSFRS